MYYFPQIFFAKIIIFSQNVVDIIIIVCYNHRQLRDTRSRKSKPGAQGQGQEGKKMENNYWYAVMMDLEDNDWGTGSYDLQEATEKVLAYRANGCPDAYIAVIDDGSDPVCVDEIHEF